MFKELFKNTDSKVTLLIVLWILDKLFMVALFIMFGN